MLHKKYITNTICATFLLGSWQVALAQENSPYSRYGIGDITPNTNVVNRGMAGISAAQADVLSINFNNPASYSNFQTLNQGGKQMSGRVILDVGINYESKTLRNPNQTERFSSSYGYFSYVQLGMPLKKGWGLSFGLRPVSRINYKINRVEELKDPLSGKAIDSALTQFAGSGGAFLPTIGTGFAIKNLSLGVNMGYLFGRKEYSTRRALVSDTVSYQSSNHSNRSFFGGLFFNAGLQYKINLKVNADDSTTLRIGGSGNWEQKINATQDIIRETFVTDANGAQTRLDSAYEKLDATSKLVYPASYTVGFVLDHLKKKEGRGWLLGVDYTTSNWNNYRFFDAVDAVKTNWQLKIGGQLRPKSGSNYFSNVAYRAGFFTGTDYINVSNKELPVSGVTFGLGLPIANYNRLTRQFTIINLGFEYARRGDNSNTLKENLFRVSVGLNFSDIWFDKRRYE